MNLFKDKIQFLGHKIYKGTLSPIDRVIQFADKFPDEIKDKNQLQRFLGSLNYVSDYFQGLKKIYRPLYKRLEKNPPPWTEKHTMIIRQIKKYVKQLPYIVIPSPNTFKIFETDASDIGYGGILKQVAKNDTKEQIVRFHSSFWSATQQNYSTIKKKIIYYIMCFKISK